MRQTIPFNQALLGKWLWRFATENTAFWRQVIASKYGVGRGDWDTKEVRGRHGVCLWKHIRRGWQHFNRYVSFSIGSGERVSFWHDRWCGAGVMQELFPTLYHIAQDRQAMVSDYLSWNNEEMVWVVILQRALQDWELADFTTFMETLYNIHLKRNGSDQMQWEHTGSGQFEVRSFYHIICVGGHSTFPWKSVWRVKVPPKVAFFTWLAAHGKNLTIDNLRRRKIWVLDWCFMCKRAGESVDHLLLHCAYASELWSFIFCMVGLQWVMPCKVSELLACWRRRAGTSKNVIWNAIPSCLMWLIW